MCVLNSEGMQIIQKSTMCEFEQKSKYAGGTCITDRSGAPCLFTIARPLALCLRQTTNRKFQTQF